MDGKEHDIEPDLIEEMLRQFMSAGKQENANRDGEMDWTDDYPSFLIKMCLEERKIYSAFSESQQDGMLPWVVSHEWGRSGINSYNKELSAAIAALLPDGFLNGPSWK